MDKLNLGGIGEKLKPVGDKLRSGGERLKPVGERLRSGGAEMGRIVSGKMKEIFQDSSQESKMVDEATSEKLEQPNWSLNLKICSLVNSEEFDDSQVVRAIKRKISGRSAVSVSHSLELLELCAMNCDKVFSEIASEKVLDDMVRLIDNPQTSYDNRKKALQLINAWGESDDLAYLPAFKQTYMALKEKNMAEMIEQAKRSAPQFSSNKTIFVKDKTPPPSELYGWGLSEVEKKEALVLARNSVDLLSSILKENPTQDNDLMMSILEKCREVQPVIRKIIESTGDDETMLFEAISLNDEIGVVLSSFGDIGASISSESKAPDEGEENKSPEKKEGHLKSSDVTDPADGASISNESKAPDGGEENNQPEKKEGHLKSPDVTDPADGSSTKNVVQKKE